MNCKLCCICTNAQLCMQHASPQITDEAQAQSDPELAVLSVMAHGQDADIHKSV